MDYCENNPDNINPLTFEGYTTLKAYIKALQKIEDETPNTIFYIYQDHDYLIRRFITSQEFEKSNN